MVILNSSLHNKEFFNPSLLYKWGILISFVYIFIIVLTLRFEILEKVMYYLCLFIDVNLSRTQPPPWLSDCLFSQLLSKSILYLSEQVQKRIMVICHYAYYVSILQSCDVTVKAWVVVHFYMRGANFWLEHVHGNKCWHYMLHPVSCLVDVGQSSTIQ